MPTNWTTTKRKCTGIFVYSCPQMSKNREEFRRFFFRPELVGGLTRWNDLDEAHGVLRHGRTAGRLTPPLRQ